LMKTLPNNTSGERLFMQHTLDIPPCCPVSGNPLAGSRLTIFYRAKAQVLDILPLPEYIRQFVGGLRKPDGNYDVHDMEGLIIRVAADCANAVAVPVKVYAHLRLKPNQEMCIVARGSEAHRD